MFPASACACASAARSSALTNGPSIAANTLSELAAAQACSAVAASMAAINRERREAGIILGYFAFPRGGELDLLVIGRADDHALNIDTGKMNAVRL